uniref:Coluporin-10 n=1 Tax=Colubraria reticulata TaxID=604273 RepID=A0A499RIQ9_9CAEN|nr:coluporin-10 [Colubraria reticulata]
MIVQFPSLKKVLVIFLFVIGRGSPPVTGAITADVTDGRSLAGKVLDDFVEYDYRVHAVIQVENWTRYPMINPVVRLGGGVITSLPYNILPGKREAFAARKSHFTPTGSYGIVAWELAGTDRLFVLMWCEPYAFNLYSNWMGLGMTKKGHMEIPPEARWFDQMYYGKSDTNFTFSRRKFTDDSMDPVAFRDDKEFQIMGVMSPNHHAQIKVTFLPVKSNYDNLAPQLRDLLKEGSK